MTEDTRTCSLCGSSGLHRCLAQEQLELRAQKEREFWERCLIAAMVSPIGPEEGTEADWADAMTEEWRKRFNPRMPAKVVAG